MAGEAPADVYAELRAWCVKRGHGLGQKDREADRWVAATAMWLGAPVVAHDTIFAGVESCQIVSYLDQGGALRTPQGPACGGLWP